MKKEHIRPFLWGSAVGAIVLLIVIFSAGWVVTSGSAQITAKAMVTSAVMERLAPISIAQFMEDPNKETKLIDLKKLDYWKRGEFVQNQGWATMPGEKAADSGLADECARRLVELKM
ncbi:MAG TPA: hypothetical protein VN328_09195 [Thermodesulfovibrionales bacterium]|jgi:hypothetical protein|nr:hypothetical protein [Thermodesulfovibrionales bacterium]